MDSDQKLKAFNCQLLLNMLYIGTNIMGTLGDTAPSDVAIENG